MSGYKRKPIGPKLRYTVFSRDNFTCVYCGRGVPEVVLQVDHILPVAEGGTNDIDNLVTACAECNLGKGKTILEFKKPLPKKQEDELKNRVEQLQMVRKYRIEKEKLKKEYAFQLAEYISLCYNLSEPIDDTAFFRLLDRFSFNELYSAIDIAKSQYSDVKLAMTKIGGIAYNEKKTREDPIFGYYLKILNTAKSMGFSITKEQKQQIRDVVYQHVNSEFTQRIAISILKDSDEIDDFIADMDKFDSIRRAYLHKDDDDYDPEFIEYYWKYVDPDNA